MDERLHFNYIWAKLDEEGVRRSVREFLDNGANRFVITDTLLGQMMEDRKNHL